MKKTILASAILLAGAANAAEIYNNEGATLSLNGSMRVNAVVSDKDDAKDFTLQDSGSRFDIKASQEVEEGLKAFGKIEVKRDGDDGDKAYFNNAYVGFESADMGTVRVGKFISFNDSLVMNDFTYDGGLYDHQEFSGFGTTDHGEYTKAFGDVKVVITVANEDTYEFGAMYEAAGLELGFSYGVANDVGATTPLADNSAYILGARYNVDALTVAVQYQATEISEKDYKGYGIGAEYAMGQARAYAMYDITDYTDQNQRADKGNTITLGADYVLAKGVKTYAEFYSIDSGKAGVDTENKVIFGGRVYF